MSKSLVFDVDGSCQTDWSFHAYHCFPHDDIKLDFLEVEAIQRDFKKHIVISQNINGGGHRSHKIVRLIQEVKKQYGDSPTLILLQELRRPIF